MRIAARPCRSWILELVVSASVGFIFPLEISHFGAAGTFLGYA